MAAFIPQLGRHTLPANIPGLHSLSKSDITDDLAFIQVNCADDEFTVREHERNRYYKRSKMVDKIDTVRDMALTAALTQNQLRQELNNTRNEIFKLREANVRIRQEISNVQSERAFLEIIYESQRSEYEAGIRKMQISRNDFETHIIELRGRLTQEEVLTGQAFDYSEEYKRLESEIAFRESRNEELQRDMNLIQSRMNFLETVMQNSGLTLDKPFTGDSETKISPMPTTPSMPDEDKDKPVMHEDVKPNVSLMPTTPSMPDEDKDKPVMHEDVKPNVSLMPTTPTISNEDKVENMTKPVIEANLSPTHQLLHALFESTNGSEEFQRQFQTFSVALTCLEETLRSKDSLIEMLNTQLNNDANRFRESLVESNKQIEQERLAKDEALKKIADFESNDVFISELKQQLVYENEISQRLRAIIEVIDRRLVFAEKSYDDSLVEISVLKSGLSVMQKNYSKMLEFTHDAEKIKLKSEASVKEMKAIDSKISATNEGLESSLLECKQRNVILQTNLNRIESDVQIEARARCHSEKEAKNMQRLLVKHEDERRNHQLEISNLLLQTNALVEALKSKRCVKCTSHGKPGRKRIHPIDPDTSKKKQNKKPATEQETFKMVSVKLLSEPIVDEDTKISEDVKHKEEKIVGKSAEHIEESKDHSPPSHIPPPTPSRKAISCTWIGEPIASTNGKSFYNGVVKLSQQFLVGDTVSILDGSHSERPVLASIEAFWEENNDMFFEGRCFIRPDETQIKNAGKREVFETDKRSIFSPSSIHRLCSISYPNILLPLEEIEANTQGRDRFYCRSSFEFDNQSISPLK